MTEAVTAVLPPVTGLPVLGSVTVPSLLTIWPEPFRFTVEFTVYL